MNSINIKKVRAGAVIPAYATESSAGADLYACLDGPVCLSASATVMIPTGIAMAIPEGYVGLICARSGLATRQGVAPANKVGVIDSDYRGELMVALYNHSNADAMIEPGQRIAQLLICPVMNVRFTECDELDETDRGGGGFGSTGNK